MPLTEIRKEIEDETKKQVKGIHDDAQKECDSILDEAKERAKEIAKSHDDETSAELNRLTLENSASAELAANEIELTAREAALENEISDTRSELIKAIKGNSTLYKRLFSNAIKEASAIAQMRKLTILVNKEDAKLLDDTDARVEYRNINGLVIESLDKDIRIDATLENIVDSKKEQIKSVLLESMFKIKANDHPKAVSRRPAHKKAETKAKKPSKKGKKR